MKWNLRSLKFAGSSVAAGLAGRLRWPPPLSFQVSKSFSASRDKTITPAYEGEKMLYEVNPSPDELLPLIVQAFKPALFSMNLCIESTFWVLMTQPELLCLVGAKDSMRRICGAGTGSPHLSAELSAGGRSMSYSWMQRNQDAVFPAPSSTANSKSHWSWHLKTCSPPPPRPPLPPHPLAPSAAVCETQVYLWTHSNSSSPPNPFWNLVGQLFLGIKIHLEQTTQASH